MTFRQRLSAPNFWLNLGLYSLFPLFVTLITFWYGEHSYWNHSPAKYDPDAFQLRVILAGIQGILTAVPIFSAVVFTISLGLFMRQSAEYPPGIKVIVVGSATIVATIICLCAGMVFSGTLHRLTYSLTYAQ